MAEPTEIVLIRRLEHIIDGRVQLLEEHRFATWDAAFAYLEGRLHLVLSEEQRDEIRCHPDTQTNPRREFVSAGGAAYTAQVSYEIEQI